jgi:hypothetical protein
MTRDGKHAQRWAIQQWVVELAPWLLILVGVAWAFLYAGIATLRVPDCNHPAGGWSYDKPRCLAIALNLHGGLALAGAGVVIVVVATIRSKRRRRTVERRSP